MPRILFAKSPTLAGRLIRLFLFSNFNHVGIALGGVVYDASSRGVRATPEAAFRERWSVRESIPVAIPNRAQTEHFLKSQLGAPYDWRAILAMPFRGSWHKKGAWFCSELIAKALVIGGLSLRLPANRITPRDLYFAIPSEIDHGNA